MLGGELRLAHASRSSSRGVHMRRVGLPRPRSNMHNPAVRVLCLLRAVHQKPAAPVRRRCLVPADGMNTTRTAASTGSGHDRRPWPIQLSKKMGGKHHPAPMHYHCKQPHPTANVQLIPHTKGRTRARTGSGAPCATALGIRHSLFSDIFMPTKTQNILHPRKLSRSGRRP